MWCDINVQLVQAVALKDGSLLCTVGKFSSLLQQQDKIFCTFVKLKLKCMMIIVPPAMQPFLKDSILTIWAYFSAKCPSEC